MENSEQYESVESMLRKNNIETSNDYAEQEFFQICSDKNHENACITYIDKYKYIPTFVILKHAIDDFDCIMVSYLVAITEIIEMQPLRMIGYLIEFGDVQIAQLNFVFVPDNKINTDNISKTNYSGHFEIQLYCNDKDSIELIKYIDKYPGKEESIYILADILTDNGIIKKIGNN